MSVDDYNLCHYVQKIDFPVQSECDCVCELMLIKRSLTQSEQPAYLLGTPSVFVCLCVGGGLEFSQRHMEQLSKGLAASNPFSLFAPALGGTLCLYKHDDLFIIGSNASVIKILMISFFLFVFYYLIVTHS